MIGNPLIDRVMATDNLAVTAMKRNALPAEYRNSCMQ